MLLSPVTASLIRRRQAGIAPALWTVAGVWADAVPLIHAKPIAAPARIRSRLLMPGTALNSISVFMVRPYGSYSGPAKQVFQRPVIELGQVVHGLQQPLAGGRHVAQGFGIARLGQGGFEEH